MVKESASNTVRALCAHYQVRSPVNLVKKFAYQLRERSGQSQPPYNLERLIPLCPVPLSPTVELVDTTYDGYLYRMGDRFQIAINARHPLSRQRFSLAHELVHTLFLPFHSEERRRGSVTPGQYHDDLAEERLCNIGAVELLMPEYVFKNRLVGKPTAQLVISLAHDFQVSYQAAAIRLCEFTRLPIMVGLLEIKKRSPQNLFKLLWHARARGIPRSKEIPVIGADVTIGEVQASPANRFNISLAFHVKGHNLSYVGSIATLTDTNASPVLFTAWVG